MIDRYYLFLLERPRRDLTLRTIFALIRLWRRRSRERALLATLSDRTLHDIGITRLDAAREYDKPFWRE